MQNIVSRNQDLQNIVKALLVSAMVRRNNRINPDQKVSKKKCTDNDMRCEIKMTNLIINITTSKDISQHNLKFYSIDAVERAEVEPLKDGQERTGEVERHGTVSTSLCCKVSCKVFLFCCFFSLQLVLLNVFDSRYSKVELVEYLLERGMEVDALGEEGMTALHYVSRWVY